MLKKLQICSRSIGSIFVNLVKIVEFNQDSIFQEHRFRLSYI